MAGRPKKRDDGKCLKCGENLAVEGQSWCTECFTFYARSRRKIISGREEARGFARGVEAMVSTLADEFDRFPGIRVTCDEVAGKIRMAPRPRPQSNGS